MTGMNISPGRLESPAGAKLRIWTESANRPALTSEPRSTP